MDWISLAVVAAFFILPLIQEVLKAVRKSPDEAEDTTPLEGPAHTPPIVPGGAKRGAPEGEPPVAVTTPPAPPRREPIRLEQGSARRVDQEAESIRTHSSAAAAKAALEAARSSEKLIRRETRPNEAQLPGGPRRPGAARVKVPAIPRVLPGASNSRAVKGKVREQAAVARSISSKEGLRAGIVLREVLGPPVALRGESELI